MTQPAGSGPNSFKIRFGSGENIKISRLNIPLILDIVGINGPLTSESGKLTATDDIEDASLTDSCSI